MRPSQRGNNALWPCWYRPVIPKQLGRSVCSQRPEPVRRLNPCRPGTAPIAPGDDEASIAKARYRRLGLDANDGRVDEEFGTVSESLLTEDLRAAGGTVIDRIAAVHPSSEPSPDDGELFLFLV